MGRWHGTSGDGDGGRREWGQRKEGQLVGME